MFAGMPWQKLTPALIRTLAFQLTSGLYIPNNDDRGISQEQLAEKTQLSLRTIQRVEAEHRVSYASLRALAVTFDLNVDLLLTRRGVICNEHNKR
jgi:hypothetical protein